MSITKATQRSMQQSRIDAEYTRPFVIQRSGGKCELCGDHHPWTLEVHHIIPVNRGGDGYSYNLIGLCPTCHAVIEKLSTDAIEDPRFHDWIRAKYGEDGYEKFGYLLQHKWNWGTR